MLTIFDTYLNFVLCTTRIAPFLKREKLVHVYATLYFWRQFTSFVSTGATVLLLYIICSFEGIVGNCHVTNLAAIYLLCLHRSNGVAVIYYMLL